ncbi:MAG: hypothetical protein JWR30_3681 [Conexibacter sp.]|jgi:hypothetical protein|nr:hypothetical protein [Conexibacter sp.]
MAQTKRKRRTKHRGNAAGMVEARGRTSGKVPPAKGGKGGALRTDRLDRPPSWRSAANRAAIATILFIAVITLIGQKIGVAIAIGAFMFCTYIPLGYYTDSYIYKRRMAKRAAGKR